MVHWDYEIDIKDVWEASQKKLIGTKELVKGIVEKFNALPIGTLDSHIVKLLNRLENLEDDCDLDLDFDPVWNKIYDWADIQRVWIETF